MPIDPSIPLGIHPPAPGPSILDTYATITELQARKAAGEERRAAAEEARATRQRLAEAEQRLTEAVTVGPDGQPHLDMTKVIGHLPADVVFKVQEQVGRTAHVMQQLRTSTLTAEEKAILYRGELAKSVAESGNDPVVFDLAVASARRADALTPKQAEEMLAFSRDPAFRAERVKGAMQLAAGLQAGSSETGFTLGPGQVRYGPRGEQIAAGPPRESTTAADSFTLSPGSVRFGPSGEQIAAVPAAPREPRDERIVSVMGPDGKPIYVRESQALGQAPVSGAGGAGRPATEGERKAAGFHGQMQQALATINRLEATLTERDLYQIQALPQEGVTGAINRSAMSDNAKRYIQAFNQFTEARLRPVSGAAIADSEYARDRATYGRQYAETPELATQRSAARSQALQSLAVMAGSALEGEQTTAAPADGAPKKDPLGIR